MDCEATPYNMEYFMRLRKSELACQCCVWTSNLVMPYICHALFYKVNDLGLLGETAVSVRAKQLCLGACGVVVVVLKEVFVSSPE